MGTFLFVGGQRGFTLVETVVAVGIAALLTFGIVTLSLALRPGALRATIGSFDASFAAARAIAATSGNGATIVVLSRSDASGHRLPGFTLRVYSGRPTAAKAVRLADVPALIADADVREATLGAPPFSIFLSTAGNASGLAAYPALANDGTPQFAQVAKEPPCPAGGLVLTFVSSHATQTRVLPCGASAFGSPIPLATESPAPVLLTPKGLVFYWPTAPVQTFVATEWGYTRWFSGDAFACGANVAQFPQSDPAPPYSAPHAPDDATALPLAPVGVPVSFADAPDSMQDAPARFPLAPATAGFCTATIADAYGQTSTMRVQVMGLLTASPSALSWAKDDTRAQSVTLGKTFDGERLRLSLASPACLGIVTLRNGRALVAADPTTGEVSSQSVIVTPVTDRSGSNVGGSCSLTYMSQYAGEPPATIAIDVAVGAGSAMQTWPALARYGLNGAPLTVANAHRSWNVAMALNAMLGGAIAHAAVQCSFAQALKADGTTPDLSPPGWTGVAPDANGCFDGRLYAGEPGGTATTFTYNSDACSPATMQSSTWSANPAVAAGLTMIPGSQSGSCNVRLNDSSNSGTNTYYNGLATVQVIGCSSSSGYIPVGGSCVTAALPPNDNSDPQYCDPTLGLQGAPSTTYFYSFGQGKIPVTTNAYATLVGGTLIRTAPGAFDLYVIQDTGTLVCKWNVLNGTWQVDNLQVMGGVYATIPIT